MAQTSGLRAAHKPGGSCYKVVAQTSGLQAAHKAGGLCYKVVAQTSGLRAAHKPGGSCYKVVAQTSGLQAAHKLGGLCYRLEIRRSRGKDKMKISVILGHPQPGSFNHAIAGRAVETLRRAGHEVWDHDLYAEGFDPLLPAAEIPKGAPLDPLVTAHCAEIAAAEGIVVVHPNWWGQPPAILKGWIDRVLRPGVAYEFLEGDSGEGVPAGLLQARAALVFNTANTPAAREQAAFGDPLERLWKDCIFDLCGVKTFYRRTFGVIVTSTPAQRAAWLDEVAEVVATCFPRQASSAQ